MQTRLIILEKGWNDSIIQIALKMCVETTRKMKLKLSFFLFFSCFCHVHYGSAGGVTVITAKSEIGRVRIEIVTEFAAFTLTLVPLKKGINPYLLSTPMD